MSSVAVNPDSRSGSTWGLSLRSAPSSSYASRESLSDPNFSARPRTPQLSKTPTSEATSRKDTDEHIHSHSRHDSGSNTSREKSVKLRTHNLFMKKVPKGAESCIIFVASVSFVSHPVTIFVRLKESVLLEDFCEIPAPTRFLAMVLGPSHDGDESRLTDIGKALGTIMADQIFPVIAYRASNKSQVLSGIDTYTQGVTVLPPSVWDPKTRLEPPKSLPSLDSRLSSLRHHSPSPMRQSSVAYVDHGGEDSSAQTLAHEEDILFFTVPKDKKENGASLRDMQEVEGGLIDDLEASEDPPAALNYEENIKEALEYTGRPFGGLIKDIRRKLPWFISDFTDAIHVQTLAAIIYIYLATITKAITFGGFLGDITGGVQGVLESFLGHALAGGFFCLFGGQPLTVLGCTGPVLIFEKILVEFCTSLSLDYMTFRLWIGLWSSSLCLVIVATDASVIVRYFTRFTEESFAALIGIIFIVEALKKLFSMSKKYQVHTGYDHELVTLPEEACWCTPPASLTANVARNITRGHPQVVALVNASVNGTLSFEGDDDIGSGIPWQNLTLSQCKTFGGILRGHACEYVPDIFFFSVVLFFGTFAVAFYLKKFKLTPFFPAKVRTLISDYAVIIAILIFVGVDSTFDLHTPKLIVPTIFKPTRSDVRGWMIPFTLPEVSWYFYIAALIPALLLTILLFMDQQITSVIVNRSEHKLKKGCGYHLDMLIVGVMIGVCSVFGLPWCVAATVLCLGHVDSLKMETETSAPGERPQFLGVREQRVTGVMVFVLTGLSVKLAPILKFIPMPVLYGVLMYMGVASLRGMQFIDRIGLLLMPTKHQPDHIYLRHVPLKKVHLFTFIQVVSLALLWIIKSTPASLIFPLMVLALVGFRKAMDFCPSVFSQRDLYWLDNLMPDCKAKGKKKTVKASESADLDGTLAEKSKLIDVSKVFRGRKEKPNGDLKAANDQQ